jgi:hypothetical protein
VPLRTELYDREEARKAFVVLEDSSGRKAQNWIYAQSHNAGLDTDRGSTFVSDFDLSSSRASTKHYFTCPLYLRTGL